MRSERKCRERRKEDRDRKLNLALSRTAILKRKKKTTRPRAGSNRARALSLRVLRRPNKLLRPISTHPRYERTPLVVAATFRRCHSRIDTLNHVSFLPFPFLPREKKTFSRFLRESRIVFQEYLTIFSANLRNDFLFSSITHFNNIFNRKKEIKRKKVKFIIRRSIHAPGGYI